MQIIDAARAASAPAMVVFIVLYLPIPRRHRPLNGLPEQSFSFLVVPRASHSWQGIRYRYLRYMSYVGSVASRRIFRNLLYLLVNSRGSSSWTDCSATASRSMMVLVPDGDRVGR